MFVFLLHPLPTPEQRALKPHLEAFRRKPSATPFPPLTNRVATAATCMSPRCDSNSNPDKTTSLHSNFPSPVYRTRSPLFHACSHFLPPPCLFLYPSPSFAPKHAGPQHTYASVVAYEHHRYSHCHACEVHRPTLSYFMHKCDVPTGWRSGISVTCRHSWICHLLGRHRSGARLRESSPTSTFFPRRVSTFRDSSTITPLPTRTTRLYLTCTTAQINKAYSLHKLRYFLHSRPLRIKKKTRAYLRDIRKKY